MKYPSNPTVVGTIKKIDKDGNDEYLGDKVITLGVRQEKENQDGHINIDINDFDKKETAITIEISLPELISAISCATLNADHSE